MGYHSWSTGVLIGGRGLTLSRGAVGIFYSWYIQQGNEWTQLKTKYSEKYEQQERERTNVWMRKIPMVKFLWDTHRN